jgi:hypothetical protein
MNVAAAQRARSSTTNRPLLPVVPARLGEHIHQIIDQARDIPSTTTYLRRFDSLLKAYKLIGYEPPRSRIRAAAAVHAHRSGEHSAAARYGEEVLGAWRHSDEELLKPLRKILAEHGYISTALMLAACTASHHLYRKRIGSLYKAYRLAGYDVAGSRASGPARAWYARQMRRSRPDPLRALASPPPADRPDELSDRGDECRGAE